MNVQNGLVVWEGRKWTVICFGYILCKDRRNAFPLLILLIDAVELVAGCAFLQRRQRSSAAGLEEIEVAE